MPGQHLRGGEEPSHVSSNVGEVNIVFHLTYYRYTYVYENKTWCHELEEEECDGIVYLDRTAGDKGILRCCEDDVSCVLIKKNKIG